MGNTIIAYQEIRIDVRDEQITHCYVLVENMSRDGFPVGGWYHKAFPARMSALDIMKAWADGEENPIMWSHGAPPIKEATGVALSEGLIDRIKAAEQRIQNNHAPRRIPADSTDVDLVLAEVRLWLEGKPAPFWLGAAKQDDQRND